MFLSRRDPLGSTGSHSTTLDIIFIVAVAVLVTLLCTVAILHCILRCQQRQLDDQRSPDFVLVHLGPGSQEKTNGAVAPDPKYTSFSTESTWSPFRSPDLGPSSLDSEKASEINISDKPTIACPTTPYLPLPRHHVYRPPP